MHRWIIIEGLDGSGKSTAIEILKQFYENNGKRVVITRGIGSGDIGKFLRAKIVEDESTDTDMNTVAFPLALMDCVNCVASYLYTYDVVITDRFLGSYYAYEKKSNQVLTNELIKYVRKYVSDLVPQIPTHVFVDTDIRTCITRINRRGNKEFADFGTKTDFMNTLYRFGEYYKDQEFIKVDNNSDLATFEQLLLNRVTQ